jgi:hypothetical protein
MAEGVRITLDTASAHDALAAVNTAAAELTTTAFTDGCETGTKSDTMKNTLGIVDEGVSGIVLYQGELETDAVSFGDALHAYAETDRSIAAGMEQLGGGTSGL